MVRIFNGMDIFVRPRGPGMISPFINLGEAARYLRMDHLDHPEEMLCRRIRDGRLKAWKNGKFWLTTVEALNDYLEIHGGGKC